MISFNDFHFNEYFFIFSYYYCCSYYYLIHLIPYLKNLSVCFHCFYSILNIFVIFLLFQMASFKACWAILFLISFENSSLILFLEQSLLIIIQVFYAWVLQVIIFRLKNSILILFVKVNTKRLIHHLYLYIILPNLIYHTLTLNLIPIIIHNP